MIRIVFFFFFLVFINSIYAQNVFIKGTEKSYSGDELVIYKYSDLITKQEVELDRCGVDSLGNFEFNFDLDKTTIAFIYLEIYKGFIFIEPDSVYEVKLPPKIKKVFEDEINPFFQEAEMDLGVINSNKNELNYIIKQFDDKYNSYINNNFRIIRYEGTREVDTMIYKLNEEFDNFENEYFKDYKYYKIAALRHLAYERNNNYIIRYYFLNKPILHNNIAYMELFNQIFGNYFYTYSKTKNGASIYSDVAYAKSIEKIKETLDRNLALANDTLQELVILKACYDECYQNNYPFSSIIQTLDSLIILTKLQVHKKIAENIISQTTHLRPGYNAPDFELYDTLGNRYSIADFNDKYLYLNFCTDWSYKCKEEFSLLKNIRKNHSDKLEIVTITPKKDYLSLSKYFTENEFVWPIYYFENEEIIDDYKLKVYPTYYLVNPNGTLSLSPAPSPNENFEWYFFKILRSRK